MLILSRTVWWTTSVLVSTGQYRKMDEPAKETDEMEIKAKLVQSLTMDHFVGTILLIESLNQS